MRTLKGEEGGKRRSGRNDIKLQKKREAYIASYFLGVAFFFAAVLAGGAVVLVTRPDLVLPMTLGCSTTAGAWDGQSAVHGDMRDDQLTAVAVLRALPELALGRPAGFLAVVVFLTAAVLGPGLAAAFLGAAAFLVVVALVAVFCWKM